jgi:hypothetical protein
MLSGVLASIWVRIAKDSNSAEAKPHILVDA